MIGYRHVIATQWTIDDTTAPHIADTVYGYLTETGRPESVHAAHALHYAVTELRAQHPHDPFTWAPYIHIGP